MTPAWPRYVLFSEAPVSASSESGSESNTWRFVLSSVETQHTIAASDTEPEQSRDRLELMAVVRGLEALDQPAQVTLISRSRYIRRGIQRGLREWRAGGWKWERFGSRVPIRDCDLWQRIDRALEFHRVDCRLYRLDTVVSDNEATEPMTPTREITRPVNRLAEDEERSGTIIRRTHSLFNEPAMVLVRPPKPARRGVIRFHGEKPAPEPTAVAS